MCGLAEAGLGLSLLGTFTGGFAQQQQQQAQAQAARAAANWNAQVLDQDAQTSRLLAMAELAKGADDRSRLTRAGLANQGAMAAHMGASGFEMDSGTNLNLLGQNAEEIAHDASTVTHNANVAAWQHETAANRAKNEAAFARQQGILAGNSNSNLAMAGTFLGGIGQGLSGYYQIKNTGMV